MAEDTDETGKGRGISRLKAILPLLSCCFTRKAQSSFTEKCRERVRRNDVIEKLPFLTDLYEDEKEISF